MLPLPQSLCQPLVGLRLEGPLGLGLGVLDMVVKIGIVLEKVVRVLLERVEKGEDKKTKRMAGSSIYRLRMINRVRKRPRAEKRLGEKSWLMKRKGRPSQRVRAE